MSALAFRAKRVFRPSTPRIMRLHSSGSSRGCYWSTVTGHTRGTGTCESNVLAYARLSHLFLPGLSTSSTKTLSVSVYSGGSKSTVVGVHNSAFTIFPLPLLLLTSVVWIAFSSILISCGGTRSGRSRRSSPSVCSTVSLVCNLYAIVVALTFITIPPDDDVLMALPELYRYGREGHWFNMKLFLAYMLDGILQVCSRILCRFYRY